MAIAQTSTSPYGCWASSCMAPLLEAFSLRSPNASCSASQPIEQVDDSVADETDADGLVEPLAVLGLLTHLFRAAPHAVRHLSHAGNLAARRNPPWRVA